MNKIIATTLVLFSCFALLAQDDITNRLRSLSDQENYERIVSDYSENIDGYSIDALILLAEAHYFLDQDADCDRVINMVLKAEPENTDALYLKASNLFYIDEFEEALKYYKQILEIDPEHVEVYIDKGYCHLGLDNANKALDYFQQATEHTTGNALGRAYFMIGEIQYNQKDYKKALEAYYLAKNKFEEKTDLYYENIYSIGYIEHELNNYQNAETAYKELLNDFPKNYSIHPRLIRIYYKTKEYDKADELRTLLYKAHENEELDEDDNDSFCFDIFEYKDKNIYAYERYQTEGGFIYYKHIFYVVNQEGDLDYTVQTEFSAISEEMGGNKYLLGKTEGPDHYTFNMGFDDDFKYKDLKKAVTRVIDGKMSIGASSTKGKGGATIKISE